jgi:hypothetical protein
MQPHQNGVVYLKLKGDIWQIDTGLVDQELGILLAQQIGLPLLAGQLVLQLLQLVTTQYLIVAQAQEQ